MLLRSYLSRMDEQGADKPLLADGCAYVTAGEGGHYAIANIDNEVLFIGNDGLSGMQRHIKQLRPTHTLVNGSDFAAYKIASSSLVYFIYIRRSADQQTYFVAVEKTKEGHSQGVKAFTGSLESVERSVQRVLGQAKESYYVHYVNAQYRLPAVPERLLLKEFVHDKTTIRDALRPHISQWKEAQQHDAA